MVEVLGKLYYIDIEEIEKKCRINEKSNKKIITEPTINIFTYELLKVCVERILNEFNEFDGEKDLYGNEPTTISFKFAFNTLIKNNILKEHNEYE